MWFVFASAVMFVSVFDCKDVNSYQEMSDVRFGFPLPFLSVNFQRYTPLYFPEDFCGPGSPWEDPQRPLFAPILMNYVLMFVFFYGVCKVSTMIWRCSRA